MAAGRPQNVRQGPLSLEGGTIGECGETRRLRTTPPGRLVVTRKRTWGWRQAPGWGGGGEGVCKWQNLCQCSASKGGAKEGQRWPGETDRHPGQWRKCPGQEKVLGQLGEARKGTQEAS